VKPFYWLGEASLKHANALMALGSNDGVRHVEHSQRDLFPIPPSGPARHQPGSATMMEIITDLAALFSIGVFAAHALDGWRTPEVFRASLSKKKRPIRRRGTKTRACSL
jgi:hypothetical protein